MPDITLEDRVKGLRGWVREHGDHERAAAELLIWKESWLRRPDFIAACVTQYGPGLIARIDWDGARSYCDRRQTAGAPPASSDWKILDLAIALGGCEYGWLTGMGHAHQRAIANAVTAAVGLGEVRADG